MKVTRAKHHELSKASKLAIVQKEAKQRKIEEKVENWQNRSFLNLMLMINFNENNNNYCGKVGIHKEHSEERQM